ncbi:MAG: ThiF family adenylyltransferase [Candidatus Korarchaeota archaeon]
MQLNFNLEYIVEGVADFFERNLGVISREEQNNIEKTRIAILGLGGIGGTIAELCARMGIREFIISDPQQYESTNINRQIGCTVSTIGQPKVEVMKKRLLEINPLAKICAYSIINIQDLDRSLENVNILVPASDDFAYAIESIRIAKRLSIPSVIAYPTGMLARVSVIRPNGPDPELLFGLPVGLSYEKLKFLVNDPRLRKKFRKNLEYYKNEGRWQDYWFEQFLRGQKPLPQIAPFVWCAASLATMQILYLILGLPTVNAPDYIKVSFQGITMEKFKPPNVKDKILSLLAKYLL